MFLTRVRAFGRPVFVGLIATSFAVFFAVTATIPSTEIVASIILACATVFVLLGLLQAPPPTIGQVLYQVEQDAPNVRRAAVEPAP